MTYLSRRMAFAWNLEESFYRVAPTTTAQGLLPPRLEERKLSVGHSDKGADLHDAILLLSKSRYWDQATACNLIIGTHRRADHSIGILS